MDRNLELLLEKVRDDISFKKEGLCTGQCNTYDAYARLVGEIRGLTLAEQHIMDRAKELEEDDE